MPPSEPIPITRPVLGDRELELVQEPLKSGWLVQGPFVKKFEKAFCSFSGSAFALAVSNCTTALHLILQALGLGPGDEVVVPSFTYVASANAVEHTGARPVFCDIDLSTFNLDLEAVQRAISPKTKAIMPVSLFGLSADMASVIELARKNDLYVVEDAACGLGARQNGRHAGTQGTAGAFSFHPRKAVTTGEGGMVTTQDAELTAKIEKLRNHGAEATDLERHLAHGGSLLPAFNLLGFNYRLTDLQGALGLAQMERAGAVIAARRAAAAEYNRLLKDLEDFRPPVEPPGYEHCYQSYVVLLSGGKEPNLDRVAKLNRWRNRLMAAMEADGIQVRQGTHAVHTLGYYASKYGLEPEDFPNSLLADRLSITLPLFPGISREQQKRVVGFLDRWREFH
ncbi:MAG: DegT/DnrJ/EryC1/StrS family aminotransferase [Desulfarculaceae bacterium]